MSILEASLKTPALRKAYVKKYCKGHNLRGYTKMSYKEMDIRIEAVRLSDPSLVEDFLTKYKHQKLSKRVNTKLSEIEAHNNTMPHVEAQSSSTMLDVMYKTITTLQSNMYTMNQVIIKQQEEINKLKQQNEQLKQNQANQAINVNNQLSTIHHKLNQVNLETFERKMKVAEVVLNEIGEFEEKIGANRAFIKTNTIRSKQNLEQVTELNQMINRIMTIRRV